MNLSITVNGDPVVLDIEPGALLIDVLRERLGLVGVNRGCDVGACGACTVLVDDQSVSSCISLAMAQEGKRVVTIEGVLRDGELHPLQREFIAKGASQCGFCSAGFILAALELLGRNPQPDTDQVRRWLNGNLCRCGAYREIVEAVHAAAESM